MAGASLAPGEAGATPNQRKRKAPPAPAAAAEDEAEAAAEEAERELADLDRRALEHIRGTATAPGEAGATPNQRKRKAPVPAAAAEDEAEAEAEVEELERELAHLDRRTLEHIRGTATRLVTAAVSHLAALRPPAPLEVSLACDDQEQLGKLKILKTKMEANVADLPMVFEKMKDSISRWERLENVNVNIHPVFQRKT